MTQFVVCAVLGLVVGAICTTGLWRSWTGPDGDRAWGLGALWVGAGFALVSIGDFVPGSVLSTPLVLAGFTIVVAGGVFCYWTPPPFRPRWYRAQYTPLLGPRH